MKLAINLPLMVYYQALGESVRALPPSRPRSQMADGVHVGHLRCARRPQEARHGKIAQAFTGEDMGPVAFDVDTIRKDLVTMIAEGKTRGTTLPLTERTLAVFEEAARDGWGKRDGAALPAYWPGRSNPRP